MEYWQDQPGVGVNIVDKLLNYTILTPVSVIEWALTYNVARGANLAVAHIYEMAASTIGKVTNRVRQIVAAVRQPGLPEEQTKMLQDTLDRERSDMRQLFSVIEEALISVSTGSTDEMVEGDDSLGENDQALISEWAQRWLRVFQRKLAVEETWIREELAKPLPEVIKMEIDSGNSDDAATAAANNGSGIANNNVMDGGASLVGNGPVNGHGEAKDENAVMAGHNVDVGV